MVMNISGKFEKSITFFRYSGNGEIFLHTAAAVA